jgi:excisionase family DNA binding protein
MPATNDVPPYRLTHAQAAVLLGVKEQTVSQWVSQGRLPSVGYYAKRNLLRSDVEKLSAARWRIGDPSWLTASQAAVAIGRHEDSRQPARPRWAPAVRGQPLRVAAVPAGTGGRDR